MVMVVMVVMISCLHARGISSGFCRSSRQQQQQQQQQQLTAHLLPTPPSAFSLSLCGMHVSQLWHLQEQQQEEEVVEVQTARGRVGVH